MGRLESTPLLVAQVRYWANDEFSDINIVDRVMEVTMKNVTKPLNILGIRPAPHVESLVLPPHYSACFRAAGVLQDMG